MTITCLAIGDPHFKVDNIEESQHFLIQVERHLQQLEEDESMYDYIIILGDILHSHEKIFTFAMNMAVDFITMCSKFAPTYCLVGNHDATSNTIFCGQNHWLSVLQHIENVTIIDKPTSIPGTNVICCPYVANGRFIESLRLHTPDWIEHTCIFAHQLFDGAKMGAIITENVEAWDEDYPMIISGHLHDKQLPQSNLYYVGSSQQLAFNENSEKSCCSVTIDDDDHISREEIFLAIKRRHIIHCSVEEAKTFKPKPNSLIKLIIEDEESSIKAFKKSVAYASLQKEEMIKRIQFKIKKSQEEDSEEEQETEDFLTILTKKIDDKGDPYLSSYCQHLLTGSDDCSDKDIILI